MFAYIPARGGSKRIRRKNIIDVGGKPMIGHVIESLQKVEGLKGIAVSSDDDEILGFSAKFDGVTTLNKRDESLAGDESTLIDLVREDLPRFCTYFDSNDVLMVLPTAVLVTPNFYEAAVRIYSDQKTDLVISVVEMATNGFLSLFVDESGLVRPLFPEKYKVPTSTLDKTYIDSGSFYLFNAKKASNCSMLLDLERKSQVVLPVDIGIDIDTVSDLERLKSLL